MMRRLLLLLWLCVGPAASVAAQPPDRDVSASTLTVASDTLPTDSSVKLDGLATSGGSQVLLIDTSTLGVRRRALGKSDLPGVVGYTDATQTWSLLQTYTSGLTSNGLLTIGGTNDLLLGTGGMRVASGSINLRNIADSANIATFGDSAITLVRPTSLSSTLGVTGLTTLTGGAALPNGSAGTPALRFSGDLNTGLYWVSADVLGLSAGGTVRASIGSTAITLAVPTSLSSTLGVTGLSTLTGGFAAGANSSVTGNLTISATTQAPGWASQTSGWGITSAGAADFRSVFANQARYQSFITDLSEAHNGGQVWVKSTAVVTSFTCPALGGTATLTVQDFPEAPNVRVFSSGDQVALFTLARTDGDSDGATDLTYGYCIGAVTSYSDGAGVQSWTFTRGSGAHGGDLATSTVIPAGSLALDYGVSGDGYLEAQVNAGAEGINGPWLGVATWATSPAPSNRTARARLGQLRGITSTDEYGLLAGTYAATDGRFFRASDQSFDLHGIDLTIWDGSTQAFAMRRNSGAPYFGIGSPAPTSFSSGTGFWCGDDGGTYKCRVGNPAGDRWEWNGSTMSVVGNGSGLTSISGGNITTGSITATQIAANTITTGNLLVGMTDNRILNGDFESGIDGWACIEGGACAYIVPSTYGVSGPGTLVINPPSGQYVAAGYKAVPVVAGETYYIRLWVYASGNTAGGFYVRMSEYDTNAYAPTHITSATRTSYTDLCADCALTSGGSWKEYVYTVPSGVVSVSLSIYNWTSAHTNIYYHIDGVEMRKQIGSGHIRASSITTDKLVAGTITGWTINGSIFNVAGAITINDTDGLKFNEASSGADGPRAISWGTSTTLTGGTYGTLLWQTGVGRPVTIRASTGDVILDTDNQTHTFGESQIVLFAGGLSGSSLVPSKDNDMTLGSATKRLKNAHFNLPSESSPGYLIVGNTSVDNTRLAYFSGWTGTRTIRDSAGTGTCTLIFHVGVLTGGTC